MIYAARKADLYKLGFSRNPERRVTELGGAELLGFVPGDRFNEYLLHTALAQHSAGHEWYYPTPVVLRVVGLIEGKWQAEVDPILGTATTVEPVEF